MPIITGSDAFITMGHSLSAFPFLYGEEMKKREKKKVKENIERQRERGKGQMGEDRNMKKNTNHFTKNGIKVR